MLPTLVIGLREGLEASLIVGIIAAFLRQQGRSTLVRQVGLGVGAAVLICVAIGVALKLIDEDLPQRQQEGLETVVGLFAVAMVSYMIVWMATHAKDLRRDLEEAASAALASGSARALVVMAFLAVLREGVETVVFLLAAFNASTSPGSAATGAVLGILGAVALGYAIYRGGVRLDMAKFFRFTGMVLVLVAAGLLATAAHTAHEAGWLDIGQGQLLDLSWFVRPGTVWSSLLTGMLGIQPRPVTIEGLAYAVYLVPMMAFVVWPRSQKGQRAPDRGPSIPP